MGALNKQIKSKTGQSGIEWVLIAFCVFCAILMYVRICLGIDITDESYYVSDALAMIHGNIPYAYNNFSYGTGAVFLLIPQVFLYELIVPDCEGIFLFVRMSFVTFCLITSIFSYKILRKHFKGPHLLLLLGFMIVYFPYGIGNGIASYNYNSIPMLLTFLVSIILYDTLEVPDKKGIVKMVFSGFLMGIAVFAHPGYGLAVIIFMMLIAFRSDKKRRMTHICGYIAGGILEILIVMIPIICQVGVKALWDGIYTKLHPYPTEMMSKVSTRDKLVTLLNFSKSILGVTLLILVVTILVSIVYAHRYKRKIEIQKVILRGVSLSVLALTIWCLILHSGRNEIYRLGISGSVCFFIFLIFGIGRKYPILLYTAIYPVVYTVAEVVMIDSSASTTRFGAAVPALIAIFLILLKDESRLIRICALISIAASILLIGYTNVTFIRRDGKLNKLKYQVEEGVYKGIYTTNERAHDLLELESYLNRMVSDGEYYAFRDNVPCGYLMLHHGTMCDMATWDKLQYSYHKNTPASLYDYYRRRDTIPDKIIYVDYGRDDNLSIEDENFRYNDFVHAYYELIDDINLNDTFKHVIVYQYKGGFDGDYDYWIETYMDVP